MSFPRKLKSNLLLNRFMLPQFLISIGKLQFERLDKSIKQQLSQKLEQLSLNPQLGQPLGNKFNIDLTGFYKLYVSKKQYSIFYRIKSEIIEVIEIVGIGKRDKEAIYRLIHKRLKGHQ